MSDGVSLGQGSSCTVNCIKVGIAQIQLAANQNDGCSGTKVLDLWEPHGAYVAQGIGISQREAKHHYVRSTGKGGREKVLILRIFTT